MKKTCEVYALFDNTLSYEPLELSTIPESLRPLGSQEVRRGYFTWEDKI